MFSNFRQHYFLTRKSGFFTGTLLFILFQISTGVLAQENPPANINIEDRKWLLYSSGTRTHIFYDLYHCALYLEKRETNIDSIPDLTRPVAVRIQILASETPDQVPDPWKEAIKPEVSDKVYSRFRKQFFKLIEGDILIFTYIPGQPTTFFLNGEKKFADPGSGLMESLLEQWIGHNPVSEDLKAALLTAS